MSNLGEDPLPLSLVSQYLPHQYAKIRNGEVENHPPALLLARVIDVLTDYQFGTGYSSPEE
jgi:D-tagatose-1,6-bisphosphate aldolase subunit GatZ/KbaZ